ncbi:MAG: winged helix-turn-helix domain-containing protein [Candidatus Gracilibacteria bacterium]|jgi:DNA-binding response OmpR family regulator|nr:winged helix-turn-helix domain-containing protein [Candidatus Gracilibacteria bacterium]
MTNTNQLNIGSAKIDLKSRYLFGTRKKVPLNNKEFVLLEYFIRNGGKVLSRTEILEDVWDRNIFCNTNTVDVHISKIRKKFTKIRKKSPIKTVHSVGYIFE